MTDREAIRKAYKTGTLIDRVVETPCDQLATASEALSELHNKGEVNFLRACGSPVLKAFSRSSFSRFRRVFCQTLPKINCSAANAADTCERVSSHLPTNVAAGFIYDAFADWLHDSRTRIDDGLALVRSGTCTGGDIVRCVLLADAELDATKATAHALDLSKHADYSVRLSAVETLGRVVPRNDHGLILKVLKHIIHIVSDDVSDEETAGAVDSALRIHRRTGSDPGNQIHSILTKAGAKSTPVLRRTLAFSLPQQPGDSLNEIVTSMLSALEQTTNDETDTVDMLDSVLFHWDPYTHRYELFKFLRTLLTHEDHPVDINQFGSFQHKLGQEPGNVRGWYVVSLLLTGNHRLCVAATQVLKNTETGNALDIDLRSFSLTGPWILFLSRKTLGYCTSAKESAAALLLACLRTIPEEDRTKLEDLVFDHFLMNYWSAISLFEAEVVPGDPCETSVSRLASRLSDYLADLRRPGICAEFAPSARERQIQRENEQDMFRAAVEEAEEDSIVHTVARKSTLLYGTASVTHLHTTAGRPPVRQKVKLSTFEHTVEIPRLRVLDPIGLEYRLRILQAEEPPE